MHPWHPVSLWFAWFTSRGRFRLWVAHSKVRSRSSHSSVWHTELRINLWKSSKINENQWIFMIFDVFNGVSFVLVGQTPMPLWPMESVCFTHFTFLCAAKVPGVHWGVTEHPAVIWTVNLSKYSDFQDFVKKCTPYQWFWTIKNKQNYMKND